MAARKRYAFDVVPAAEYAGKLDPDSALGRAVRRDGRMAQIVDRLGAKAADASLVVAYPEELEEMKEAPVFEKLAVAAFLALGGGEYAEVLAFDIGLRLRSYADLLREANERIRELYGGRPAWWAIPPGQFYLLADFVQAGLSIEYRRKQLAASSPSGVRLPGAGAAVALSGAPSEPPRMKDARAYTACMMDLAEESVGGNKLVIEISHDQLELLLNLQNSIEEPLNAGLWLAPDQGAPHRMRAMLDRSVTAGAGALKRAPGRAVVLPLNLDLRSGIQVSIGAPAPGVFLDHLLGAAHRGLLLTVVRGGTRLYAITLESGARRALAGVGKKKIRKKMNEYLRRYRVKDLLLALADPEVARLGSAEGTYLSVLESLDLGDLVDGARGSVFQVIVHEDGHFAKMRSPRPALRLVHYTDADPAALAQKYGRDLPSEIAWKSGFDVAKRGREWLPFAELRGVIAGKLSDTTFLLKATFSLLIVQTHSGKGNRKQNLQQLRDIAQKLERRGVDSNELGLEIAEKTQQSKDQFMRLLAEVLPGQKEQIQTYQRERAQIAEELAPETDELLAAEQEAARQKAELSQAKAEQRAAKEEAAAQRGVPPESRKHWAIVEAFRGEMERLYRDTEKTIESAELTLEEEKMQDADREQLELSLENVRPLRVDYPREMAALPPPSPRSAEQELELARNVIDLAIQLRSMEAFQQEGELGRKSSRYRRRMSTLDRKYSDYEKALRALAGSPRDWRTLAGVGESEEAAQKVREEEEDVEEAESDVEEKRDSLDKKAVSSWLRTARNVGSAALVAVAGGVAVSEMLPRGNSAGPGSSVLDPSTAVRSVGDALRGMADNFRELTGNPNVTLEDAFDTDAICSLSPQTCEVAREIWESAAVQASNIRSQMGEVVVSWPEWAGKALDELPRVALNDTGFPAFASAALTELSSFFRAGVADVTSLLSTSRNVVTLAATDLVAYAFNGMLGRDMLRTEYHLDWFRKEVAKGAALAQQGAPEFWFSGAVSQIQTAIRASYEVREAFGQDPDFDADSYRLAALLALCNEDSAKASSEDGAFQIVAADSMTALCAYLSGWRTTNYAREFQSAWDPLSEEYGATPVDAERAARAIRDSGAAEALGSEDPLEYAGGVVASAVAYLREDPSIFMPRKAAVVEYKDTVSEKLPMTLTTTVLAEEAERSVAARPLFSEFGVAEYNAELLREYMRLLTQAPPPPIPQYVLRSADPLLLLGPEVSKELQAYDPQLQAKALTTAVSVQALPAREYRVLEQALQELSPEEKKRAAELATGEVLSPMREAL